MTSHRRLIPLLVAVLVIQGLVAVLPHTHGCGDGETGIGNVQAAGIETPPRISNSAHACLACSVHAPMVEAAADRGVVHGIERASTIAVVRWSISVLSSHQNVNPRAPPRIV